MIIIDIEYAFGNKLIKIFNNLNRGSTKIVHR